MASVKIEKIETAMDKDAEVRRILDERREARKQKLLVRLGRNLANPRSIASLEGLTGTLRSKKVPATAPNPTPKREEPIIKQESSKQPEKKAQQLKKALSFKQTTTSLSRTQMVTYGVPLKRAVSFKAIPTALLKKTPAPIATQASKLKTKQLTVPQSPKFSSRFRQTPRNGPTSQLKVSKQLEQPSVSVVDGSNRKSSTWMVPLTPEKIKTPSKSHPSSVKASSPAVRPFARKSFSEQKPPRSALSKSTNNLARPNMLGRKSVAVSFGKESRFSRSVWELPKEPTEQEKIQQWLDKRGKSSSSCRHLGCLGHQVKDLQASESKPISSARKSIKVMKPTTPCASPQLKLQRKSSVMNTTFEKEDEPEVLAPPPPLDFQNDVEEVDDKFHTPKEATRGSELDLTDLQEGRVEKLLETIVALFQEPIYPGAKIESWIYQSEAAFPAVKSHPLYWDIKARLQERRGNTMEALDIYSEALNNQVEPMDTMKQLFDKFLLRIGSEMPTGERTPLLKSLGVDTPMIRHSRRMTIRRPLHDSSQAFNSTTVKYELKLKQVFQSIGDQMKENRAATPMKKAMKTPLKFKATSNVLSLEAEGPFQLVATPVRRSMRPKTMQSMARVDEQVVYVDDLDQLSPTTKSKAIVRQNGALSSSD